jgi:RNA polymerase sigma factor (sigma-70 family)
MDDDTDAELVARARAGELDAFRVLAERYRPMVRSLAWGEAGAYGVEDLVQETLLQAWVSLDGLRDGTRFRSWLYGIALNVRRNWRRRESALPMVLDEEAGGIADPYDAVELRWLVERAMGELSAGTREAVGLFYLADLSLEEVASRLAVSPTVVKSRLHRGRGQLRQKLTAAWPERAEAGSDRVARRGHVMTEVRIARVLLVGSRLLIVLEDEAGGRILPLWLGLREARSLVEPGDFAGALLRASGSRLAAVHVDQLHDGLAAAEVLLRVGPDEQRIHTRVGEGVLLAHRYGVSILAGERLFAVLGMEVADYGTLEQAVDAAILREDAALMAPSGCGPGSGVDPRLKPSGLRCSDGLTRWDLRGSFLRDVSGQHWRDYACGSDASGAYLAAQVPEPLGFARLRQVALADSYRGGRVRLAADVKVATSGGHAGLFLRVLDAGKDSRATAPDEELIQDTDGWLRPTVEREVPDGAVAIVFGITLTGPGRVWLRNVELAHVELTGDGTTAMGRR